MNSPYELTGESANCLGLIYESSNDLENAKKCYKSAVNLKNIDAMFNLGLLIMRSTPQIDIAELRTAKEMIE